MPHAPSSHVLLMPNLNHLTHGISNLVSLITKTKLGLSKSLWLHQKKHQFRLRKGRKASRELCVIGQWIQKKHGIRATFGERRVTMGLEHKLIPMACAM
jgi:hypothetical protein